MRSGGPWGGPQEMAFLRAAAGSFRAYTWAAHAHSGSQAHASLGSPDPPFRGHSSCTGSLGTCPWTQEPSLPPRGPRDFPWATLPSSSPSSSETVCAGKTWGPGAWAGDFPGGCMMARRPLSPGECPSRPLTPAGDLIPAISGPLATWGRDTWARLPATGLHGGKQTDTSGPTPPLRRSPFSSIRKGVTLEWKNMGRPPGDGFSPSRGWLVSSPYVGRACALRLPTTSLPRVAKPTLEVSPDPPLRGHVTHP